MTHSLSTLSRITAFHGTPASFSSFRAVKKDMHPSKVGIWFASTQAAAEPIVSQAARIRSEPCLVVKASLRLEQPIRFETYRDYLDAWAEAGSDAGKLRRKLMRQGYDGIEITRSDTDGAEMRTDYAVFEPWQVDITASHKACPEGKLAPAKAPAPKKPSMSPS